MIDVPPEPGRIRAQHIDVISSCVLDAIGCYSYRYVREMRVRAWK